MGEIDVTNKTDAYNALKQMNNKGIELGEKIIKDLSSNIDSLKVNWIASNSYATDGHINRLIKIYNNLVKTTRTAINNTKVAADVIIELQKFEVMTGGDCTTSTPLDMAGSLKERDDFCQPTDRSYYGPGLNEDYSKLGTIKSNYITFIDEFKSVSNKLFGGKEFPPGEGIWKDGCNRQIVADDIKVFLANADTNISNITLAYNELGQVKDNAPRA